jgi:Leu/Phe-tRNA-protein transferase
VARLRFGGFALFDAQFVTEHLKSLGAEEIILAVLVGVLVALALRMVSRIGVPGMSKSSRSPLTR